MAFFLRHNGLNDRRGQRPFPVSFVHPPSLRIGRGAVVHFALFQHLPLAGFVKVGQLHADRQGYFAFIHLFKELRNEMSQADIALNGILADSFLLSDYLRGQLRRNLLRSYVCSLSLMLQGISFQLIRKRLFRGQNMFPVQITVHHRNGGSIPVKGIN